jgi:pimeloyl-ACP methyl ester carboxylesterase
MMLYLKGLSVLAAMGLIAACGGGGSSSATPAPNNNPGTPPASETPEPTPPIAGISCDRDSWVAGTVELCDGALIYRDYIYDDYGADTGLIGISPTNGIDLLNLLSRGGEFGNPQANTPGLLSPTAGDQRYPAGLENTADLAKLTLQLDGDVVNVTFELNTLYGSTDALAVLAIDTDNDRATGGGDWDDLGIRSDGWDKLYRFEQGDPLSNTLSGSIPAPDSPIWRIQAVVAQANGTVMNLAFRGPNEMARAGSVPEQFLPDAGNFWEDIQAKVLANGDISQFGHTVNRADLENRINQEPAQTKGFQQRVYTSEYTLPPGEGVSLQGVPGRHGDTNIPCEQYFHYLGRYQPYGFYVPEGEGPFGLQMILHGCEANHASQINQRNFQAAFAENQNRILAAPLGRGPTGFFSDISERDVRDVQADVERHYQIDSSKRIISGYSMGGYGAMRMASLYPQDYAAGVNWVGFTGSLLNLPLTHELINEGEIPVAGSLLDSLVNDIPILGDFFNLEDQLSLALSPVHEIQESSTIGAVDNVYDYVSNLQHVPFAHVYSGADELVHVTTSLGLEERLLEGEMPYQFYLHPVAEHLTYILIDQWSKEARYITDRAQRENPARVTYRYEPANAYPEYDIQHNHAYWLSALSERSQEAVQIDLTTHACGAEKYEAETTVLEGGTEVLPWVGSHRTLTQTGEEAASASLTGSLKNLHQGTIDVAATCLEGGFEYDLISDGPATLMLSDGRSIDVSQGQNQGYLP